MTKVSPARGDVPLERLLAGLLAVRDGDFSVRLPGSQDPLLDDIAAAFGEMAASLSERDAERSRFLPTLSHELRTPLNSMLVLAGLLAANPDGNLTPRQVEYASVIHSAGTDLAGVISGMVCPDGIAEDLEPAGGAAERRLLVVEASRGGLLTLLARAAASDLATVPDAYAAGPAGTGPAGTGPVTVRTAVTPGEVATALADGGYRCVVLDAGADEALVFQTLTLARASRAPVLAHGQGEARRARLARLLARSEAGPAEVLGSPRELRERIAWHMSGVPRDTVPAREVTRPPLRGRKILVVDDDQRNVFALTSTLEHHGMQAISAPDGRSGIAQLLLAPDTDLVLMDLMMPEMDGYTAISAIREIPEFSGLPIIAVTARTPAGDLENGVPGADGCVTKPLDTDELLSRMARLLTPRAVA